MTDASDERPPLLDDEWLATLRERVEAADGVLVCLDFDGTLAPIVEDPGDAAMAAANEELLRALTGAPGAAVALVSGRSLADLRDRAGVDGVHYAGNHGLERDDGGGRTVPDHVREKQPAVEEAVARLRDELSGVPGCEVEDKELTATVHYRRTPDDRTAEVLETATDVAESTDGVRLSRGKEIVELRPDVPAGKDRPVERLRERYPDYVPLFVGDDVTDEDGFRAVADDGFGVLVGDRSDTAASVRVPDPEGVTKLLGWLVEKVVESADAPGVRD